MMTDFGIEGMGFRRMHAGEKLTASFHTLHVFAIEGLTTDSVTPITKEGKVAGVSFTAGIGNSLNALSTAIVAGEFTDDEAKFAEDHKCAPPFLMVHIGPTSAAECVGGWIKEEATGITTYDQFGKQKSILLESDSAVIPALVASLSSRFGSHSSSVKFRSVRRAVYGITTEGRTLHDIRISMSAELSVSNRIDGADLVSNLDASLQLAAKIERKVARFYHLALEERDSLKRFLYFFLAIEIETHQAYKRLEPKSFSQTLVSIPVRLSKSLPGFLEEHVARSKTLGDRFVWCSICLWSEISDADIAEFRRLKKVRDAIAHGEIASPPLEAVRSVEALAAKLQLTK